MPLESRCVASGDVAPVHASGQAPRRLPVVDRAFLVHPVPPVGRVPLLAAAASGGHAVARTGVVGQPVQDGRRAGQFRPGDCCSQGVVVRSGGVPLVPLPDVINVQPVHPLGTEQPRQRVVCCDVWVGKGVGGLLVGCCRGVQPSRPAPGETVQLERWLPLLRLFHQPPLVAAVVILVASVVHVGRLSALGRICVTAHFNLEDVEVKTKVGQEEKVQNVAGSRRVVVHEQLSGCSATRDGANTFPTHPQPRGGINSVWPLRRRRRGWRPRTRGHPGPLRCLVTSLAVTSPTTSALAAACRSTAELPCVALLVVAAMRRACVG
mmetsp:Transcript_35386/g.92564  ORF Transcript_35386/g.92564 Transcript_35386/m.92564 type:complete len:322 (-) Transcript_35386:187-1152(-)